MPTRRQPFGAGASAGSSGGSSAAGAATPIEADVPARAPVGSHVSRMIRERWDVIAVIAAGGAIGSAARYGAAVLWPHDPSQLAWSTFVVNIVGGLLLGVLMVFVNDVWPPRRYVRPFVGVGVLGGFTTFSTYMLDTHSLLLAGRWPVAMLYLVGTLLIGLVAVWLGMVGGRGAAAVLRSRAARRGARVTPSKQDKDAREGRRLT